MIYTERKVSIKNDTATIDSPIILFRGDREVEIMFTIIDSKFKFESTKGNVIDKTQASFGQLAVALPDGTDLFTEIVECENGVVVFSITGEMIDEIHEVGFYSFHIRLYNDDKSSRITLPPVMEGIEIREPLIIEGDVENTDLVGEATVGYSMVETYGAREPAFDENGNYMKTDWQTGDKITASKLNKIEETLETINNDIPKEENTSLPDYWKNNLVEIGEKIDSLQKENGMDTLQFLWCSDIHGVPGTSPSNTTYIGEIGRYLMDKHNIPFFVISGDVMSQASHDNVNNIWIEYDKLAPVLSPISNEELLAVRGNHDGVWGSPMEYNGQANQYYHSYIGDKALFNAFMRRQTLDSYRRVFDTSGMYFYVDYHNYRIYMLNSHTFGDDSANEQGQAIYNGFKQCVFGSKQLQWIADTLMTVKEGQQVIFVSHAPINNMKDKYVFAQMLIAYRERTNYTKTEDVSGTYWASGTEYSTSTVTKDFTNAKGNFVGHFNGHIHTDKIEMFGYVPTFSITCAGGDVRDTYYTDGTLTRTRGTATETAIDLVTVTSDYIYCTRIGSGYDRKFNRLTNEVTIDTTPPVEEPEVELTQGEITNEVAWTMDKQLSSAGDPDKDLVGSMVSDYILVNPGDVINIYGITSLDAKAFYVNLYKDEAIVTCMPLSNANMNPTDNEYAYAKYSAAALHLNVQIKDVQSVNSIRVSCVTSAVTVYRNSDETCDTTNLAIPNATNTTDTSIWVNDYRFASSGLTVQAGTSVSNKIDVAPGDIIYIEGVVLREGTDRVAIGFINASGEEKTQLGYFNNGTTGFNYLGCINGAYQFEITEYPGGIVEYFRFAMPTPTDFSKVKVIREEGGNNSK